MSKIPLTKFAMQSTPQLSLKKDIEGEKSEVEITIPSTSSVTSNTGPMLELMARQNEALRQISEMTRTTETNLILTLNKIAEERDRSFKRAMSVLAEMERLGLVDLAPVSPILDL